jgi:UDP-N-acetylglucosamine diphosphorylase / glucose-1-phosphate thymidylyltransferase / UDP-N-acetylgalactosamine diphosphorylase / glucosamine-1-phosphate N-acetyltransferase / galactosamine-1-phosphate N-acetyltransferase
MRIVVFEDESVGQLDPVALCRPAFAISCGSRRLIDLLAKLGLPLEASVRPHLRPIVAADFPQLKQGDVSAAGPVLLVNARLVPSLAALGTLRTLSTAGRAAVVRAGNDVAAAVVLTAAQPARPEDVGSGRYLAGLGLPALETPLPLFAYPHDIVREHLATIGEHLAERIAHGNYRQLSDGVFAAAGATLGSYVVTDTKAGPIVLEAGASVGPYCYLSGPAHLGANCRVLEHAALKHAVALGHTTKIGGEVEASIIEPYSNKQHHGFLGHSYLGSWINLGAGTCNSDLKNTYGNVNMEYRGRKVSTGMQFIGAIIGDYSKTAINTGIFTGKVIGVGSMVYGFVTTNVPSFVNYARLFSQVSEAPVEVLVATQRRMFERRGVEQRNCDIQLLHDVYELTAHERQLPGETLSIEPLSL